MLTKDTLILVAEIKKFAEKLNAWEKQFISNVTGHRAISRKQAEILTRIYEKCVDHTAWQKREYV